MMWTSLLLKKNWFISLRRKEFTWTKTFAFQMFPKNLEFPYTNFPSFWITILAWILTITSIDFGLRKQSQCSSMTRPAPSFLSESRSVSILILLFIRPFLKRPECLQNNSEKLKPRWSISNLHLRQQQMFLQKPNFIYDEIELKTEHSWGKFPRAFCNSISD